MTGKETSERRARGYKSAVERREQLLNAAVAVMREGGTAAATTRAVADRAGLPQGAFHYCFHSKDEMLAALLERELNASLGDAWDAVAAAPDLESGMVAALQTILDRVRSDPEYHLLTAELLDVSARTPDLAHLARREHAAYVARTEQMLRRSNGLEHVVLAVDPRALAEALVAASTGITSSWMSSRDDDAARASVAIFSAALAQFATGRERAGTP